MDVKYGAACKCCCKKLPACKKSVTDRHSKSLFGSDRHDDGDGDDDDNGNDDDGDGDVYDDDDGDN